MNTTNRGHTDVPSPPAADYALGLTSNERTSSIGPQVFAARCTTASHSEKHEGVFVEQAAVDRQLVRDGPVRDSFQILPTDSRCQGDARYGNFTYRHRLLFCRRRYLGLACCSRRDHLLPFALCSHLARRTAALDVAPRPIDLPSASGTTSGRQCLLRGYFSASCPLERPSRALYCCSATPLRLLQTSADRQPTTSRLQSPCCGLYVAGHAQPIFFHIPRSHPVDSRHAGVPILLPGFCWATSTALFSCKAAAEPHSPEPARLRRRTQPSRDHEWHRGPLSGRSPTHHSRHARP